MDVSRRREQPVEMSDLVRATALTNFGVLVAELGGDPDALLRSVQFDASSLDDFEVFVPLSTVSELLETAARQLNCRDFGLRLSLKQRPEILGPLAIILRHSHTALAAIDDLAKFMPYYAPALRIGVEDLDAGLTRYHLGIRTPMAVTTQILELSIGTSVNNLRLLLGAGFHPAEVAFPHPPVADHRTYQAFFGCPVRWNANFCGLDLSTAALVRLRSSVDRDLRRVVARFLEDTAGNVIPDFSSHVRDQITRILPAGLASLSYVSARVNMKDRTLQRRLASEGTTFEALLDLVRRERAEHYLTNTDLPIGEVAATLGYSQASCLNRSVKRWFGSSPRQLRRSAGTITSAHSTPSDSSCNRCCARWRADTTAPNKTEA
jgi:AraC-like DNA-binding protein